MILPTNQRTAACQAPLVRVRSEKIGAQQKGPKKVGQAGSGILVPARFLPVETQRNAYRVGPTGRNKAYTKAREFTYF